MKLLHHMASLPLEPCFYCYSLIHFAYKYVFQFENLTHKICLHEQHLQMIAVFLLSNSLQF